MPTTVLLNSTVTSKYYKRNLDFFYSSPAASPDNRYIAPSTFFAFTGTVSANTLLPDKSGAVVGASDTVYAPQDTSGITFFAFSGASSIDKVSLNMAPTPSTRRDYGDSMYIDTSKQSTVKVKDSNFIVGTEVSNDSIFADNDLVFVSSSSSLNTGSYLAGAVTLNNVTANAAGTVDMNATKMEFGIGKDTLCFASSKNSVITNNSFKMGTGADYVYVAEASTIYAGNTIDMGADSEVDSIRFGGTTSLSNLGTTAKLNLSRFGSNDKLIYKNVTYTGEAGIKTNAELSSKITFNNIV